MKSGGGAAVRIVSVTTTGLGEWQPSGAIAVAG